MKKKDVREILFTAISLFLICAVSAGILAAVNAKTGPMISARGAEEEQAAKTELLPDAERFEEIALSDGGAAYAGKTAADELCGYVFTTAASSYGGKLTLMTGIDANGAVTGVKILSIEDTPGLGMNAKRPEFLAQYGGTDAELTVVKNQEAGENEIAAITSATITSRAVTSAVNAARAYYNEITGEGAES